MNDAAGADAAGAKPLATAAEPARFLLVGAGGYAVNLGIFAGLHTTRLTYVLNSIVSYFIANALMYFGNRYFTFRLGHDGFWSAYLRYMIVGAVVAGLNAGILAALVQGTGIDSRIGVAISLLVITPVAFVLFKRWTFRIKSA
jgi:putative flippase GtrA